MNLCPYRNNPFCSKLSKETLKLLCACCHIEDYPIKQNDRHRHSENLCICLEGLSVVSGSIRTEKGRGYVCELYGPGFIHAPSAWNLIPWEHVNATTIIDIRRATFDYEETTHLFETDIQFCQTLFRTYAQMYHEHCIYYNEVACGTAYTAVRYVLQFCKNHGIPPLTHAQIAFIASLARPTVTKTIRELIKKEPELF